MLIVMFINILKTMDVSYLARGSLTSPKEIMQSKKFLKKAFESQINNKGYSFVEVLSPCPTNMKIEPLEAMKKTKEEAMRIYPICEFFNEGVGTDD